MSQHTPKQTRNLCKKYTEPSKITGSNLSFNTKKNIYIYILFDYILYITKIKNNNKVQFYSTKVSMSQYNHLK